jgi:hypothetical protein
MTTWPWRDIPVLEKEDVRVVQPAAWVTLEHFLVMSRAGVYVWYGFCI